MSHKNAKRARKALHAAGIAETPAHMQTHHIEWKPKTRGGVMAERPRSRLIPGSFKEMAKRMKRSLGK